VIESRVECRRALVLEFPGRALTAAETTKSFAQMREPSGEAAPVPGPLDVIASAP
jgi:hypothetical protein